MTPTEKLLLVSCGVLAGAVVYLYRKLKWLRFICVTQQDSIELMNDYISEQEEKYNDRD